MRIGLILPLLVVSWTTAPAQQRVATAARRDSLVTQLDKMFAQVDSASTPGCVVGVDQGGERAALRSYGQSDLERRTPNDSLTVFEAGSVSKQVTAAAVLLLAHQGRLSLDDSLKRWFPEVRASVPAMTIRQLLTHESGLRDWGALVEMQGWPRGTRDFSMQDAVRLILRQRAVNFPPGAEYLYSNSNYVLAAELVKRASGMPFVEFTRKYIFAPLSMSHTSWRADFRTVVPHRATAWTPDDSSHWMLDMPFEDVIGHAGLLVTVPDLLRWQAAFTNHLIGGNTFTEEMETAGVLRGGRRSSYALGLGLDSLGGERIVDHSGATAGYRAYVGRVPSRGVAVALLCNAGSLDTQDLGIRLLALAGGLEVAVAEEHPQLGAEKSTSPLAGLYRSLRTRRAARLRAFADGITIDGSSAYRAKGNDFVSIDGKRTIVFALDKKGAPSGYRVVSQSGDSIAFDRVEPWTPAPGVLAQFAGTYTSDDVQARWRFSVAHDSLVAEIREGLSYPLIPSYRDAFTVPDEGWIVSFRRNAAGRIIGFDVGAGRARSVPFARIP